MSMIKNSALVPLLIGTGVSKATTYAIRTQTSYGKHATAIGIGAAAAVGAALYFGMKKRSLGVDVALAGIVPNLPDLAVDYGMLSLPASSTSTGMLGVVTAERVAGLGETVNLGGPIVAERGTGETVNLTAAFGSLPIAGMQ